MPYDRRDLIGHWIRKSQAEGRMCNHACCRGYRVHPDNYPVILPDRLLRRASDQDLAAHYEKMRAGRTADDQAASWQVLYELDRRDRADVRRQELKDRYRARVLGKRLERDTAVEAAWLEAERATNGYMLNKAGKAAGIDDRSLFTGPESRARRYASPELLEFWQTHHRPTAAMFAGRDTRVYEKATEPRRRQYGTTPARRAA